MNTRPSITCPDCGATSSHPRDRAEGYCGRCHWWTSDPDPLVRASNPRHRTRLAGRQSAEDDERHPVTDPDVPLIEESTTHQIVGAMTDDQVGNAPA